MNTSKENKLIFKTKGLVVIMEKMTNIKALEVVLGMELADEVREKIEKIKASYEKKGSAERKPTANQTENEAFKVDIVEFLGDGEAHTISEIMKGVPSLEGISNQRVSAIVRQLKEANVVSREEIKRKAFFTLVK